MDYIHIPVMTREVCELFDVRSGGIFVDCTVGLGGHAEAILSANPKSKLLAIDRDASALDIAKKRLSQFGKRVSFLKCNFKEVNFWKKELKNAPTGILVDLGISALQLEEGRGFSFRDSLSLDMRMDRSQGKTALEFVNRANMDDLAYVFKEFGEVEKSKKLAKQIVEYRKTKTIESGEELGKIVERCFPKVKRDKIHPATKVFQALRIFLNEEILNLDSFLKEAVKLLASSGKIIVISYHSLEDRIVKKTFAELKKGCICPKKLPVCGCGLKPLLSYISKTALRPTLEEVLRNHSSRSAKLRYGVRA